MESFRWENKIQQLLKKEISKLLGVAAVKKRQAVSWDPGPWKAVCGSGETRVPRGPGRALPPAELRAGRGTEGRGLHAARRPDGLQGWMECAGFLLKLTTKQQRKP